LRQRPSFDEWFGKLNEDAKVEIMAKVELLKLLGPRLGRPHADTLNGSKHANMKELRADTAGQVHLVKVEAKRKRKER
jgi:hypothetical protein